MEDEIAVEGPKFETEGSKVILIPSKLLLLHMLGDRNIAKLKKLIFESSIFRHHS